MEEECDSDALTEHDIEPDSDADESLPGTVTIFSAWMVVQLLIADELLNSNQYKILWTVSVDICSIIEPSKLNVYLW